MTVHNARPLPTCKPMSNVIFSTITVTWISEKVQEREIRKQRRRISLEEKHENFIAAEGMQELN